MNVDLGGEANAKAHVESREHRKKTNALNFMFQTKSASKRETVSTGPAQVWKPMTGASEAELQELPLRWQESNFQ